MGKIISPNFFVQDGINTHSEIPLWILFRQKPSDLADYKEPRGTSKERHDRAQGFRHGTKYSSERAVGDAPRGLGKITENGTQERHSVLFICQGTEEAFTVSEVPDVLTKHAGPADDNHLLETHLAVETR